VKNNFEAKLINIALVMQAGNSNSGRHRLTLFQDSSLHILPMQFIPNTTATRSVTIYNCTIIVKLSSYAACCYWMIFIKIILGTVQAGCCSYLDKVVSRLL